MAFNLGSIVGYTISGLMVDLVGWRYIFFLNVPVGVFGTMWAHLRLKEIHRGVSEKFDFFGAVLYSSALTLILIALSLENLGSPLVITLLVTGLLILPVFVIVEKKVSHPMLDLDLFKIRPFSAGNLASFLNSVAFSSLPFVLTLYLQLVRGEDAVVTGLLFIPMEAAVFLLGPLSGKFSDRYGARGLSTLGLLFNIGALVWFSTLDMSTSYVAVILGLIVAGVGRALFISPNASSIMGQVSPSKRGVGNGIRTTVVQTAVVISLPLSLTFMTLGMPYDALSQIAAGNVSPSSEEILTFLSALRYPFRLSAIMVALALVPSLLRGRKMTVEQQEAPELPETT
jgi:MFS family permease